MTLQGSTRSVQDGLERTRQAAGEQAGDSAPMEARRWYKATYYPSFERCQLSFELVCQRLLRESGFQRVEVTGRSGDGGIDGHGVRGEPLVTFKVLFQCSATGTARKSRHRRSATFGRHGGRADKGIFIRRRRHHRRKEGGHSGRSPPSSWSTRISWSPFRTRGTGLRQSRLTSWMVLLRRVPQGPRLRPRTARPTVFRSRWHRCAEKARFALLA